MPKYYLLDENKNLVEGFDKEGFLALLEEAIEQGSLENIDEDSAVASKLRSALNGTTHHIEFVTQAPYNQLVAQGQLVANTYYFITDDTTAEDLEDAIQNIINGTTQVEHADHADYAGTADYAKTTDVSGLWINYTWSDTITLRNCDVFLIDYGANGVHAPFVFTNNYRENQETVLLFSNVCEMSGHKYQLKLSGSNQNNTLTITSITFFYDGNAITPSQSTFRIKAIH